MGNGKWEIGWRIRGGERREDGEMLSPATSLAEKYVEGKRER